jgi:hypothetical protein
MTAIRRVTRSWLAGFGGLLAGRSAARAILERGLAVLRAPDLAPDLANMGFKSPCRAGPAERTDANSHRAKLQAADFLSLAMIKSP